MKLEDIIINLVINGGQGRGKAMLAIDSAKKGDFDLAEKYLKQSEEDINKAHNFQTELLQKEAAGESDVNFSLLIIHGQDHLMNAITVKDLANEIIIMYKEIFKLRGII